MAEAAGSSSSGRSGDSLLAGQGATDKKWFLVTGARRGIGLQIAKYLSADAGAIFDVILRPEPAEPAREETLWQETVRVHGLSPNNVFYAELSDINEVKDVADRIGHHPYDVIICCAAVMAPLNEAAKPTGQAGSSLDDTFIVNVLSHYILVKRILAVRRQVIRGASKLHVVTLATGGITSYRASMPGCLKSLRLPDDDHDWDAFFGFANDGQSHSGFWAYNRSKAGCVLLAQLLAHEGEVTAISVHPGNVRTALIENVRHWFFNNVVKKIGSIFSCCIVSTVERCANTVLAAAAKTDEAATMNHWMVPASKINCCGGHEKLITLPTAFHRPLAPRTQEVNAQEGNPQEGNPQEGNPQEGNPQEGNPQEDNPRPANSPPNLGPILSSFKAMLDRHAA